MTSAAPGRRERKKAATRKAISDVATTMFIERGFDKVSIREIAEAADVSPTTVFAHFPQKEALVFDEADEQRERIVAAVRDRPAGTSITQALHDHLAAEFSDTLRFAGPDAAHVIGIFNDLVRSTPALVHYEAWMWTGHEAALSAEIAAAIGQETPSDEIRAFSRFVLQVWQLMSESPDPMRMLDAAFRLLDPGWAKYAAR